VARIYFSSGLSQYTGGVEFLDVDAPRVQELLQVVQERFPALTEPMSIMTVAVDGVIHQHPNYIPLAADSEVHLVPRISGGSRIAVH
jgi:molybdopterin converting factor small subunit